MAVLGLVLLLVLASACTAPEDEPLPATPTSEPGECTPGPTPTVTPPSPTSTPVVATATFTATATPTPLPPSPTPTAPPSTDFLALQDDMRSAVESFAVDGRYAVAVTDLQTGQTIHVNGDRMQLSGCVMNLMVLLLSMRDVETGAPPETVSDLIDRTIYSSNATTARELYEIAGNGDTVEGVRRVADLIAELGMTSTIVDHPPSYPAHSLGVSDANWITALDANRALAALYHGQVLTEPWRTDLLERMVNVKTGLNYLTAWGTGGRVSHKNGFFPIDDGSWVDNDVGIVRFERNQVEYAYAISFFSDYVPEKYADIPLGQQLSVMVWEYFSATYE